MWLAAAFLLGAFSRKSVFSLVFASFLGVLTLGALELVGVFGLVDYGQALGLRGSALGKTRVPHVEITGETYQDTARTFQIPSDPVPFRYRTDQNGFRNDVDREEADVYLLGDSFLVAGLVPFADSVTGRLEKALGRPVMNVSLIGIGVQEERDLLEDLDPPLDGRVVVHFVYEGNDLADSRAWRSRGKGGGGSDDHMTLTNALVLTLQHATSGTHPSARGRMGRIGEQAYTFGDSKTQYDPFKKELPHLLAALGDTKKYVESKGGRYVVVLIPAKLRVLAEVARFDSESNYFRWREHIGGLPAEVADWCGGNGVPCLNLAGPLREAAANGEIGYFPYDTHWNSIGHRVAANALAAFGPLLDGLPPARAR